MQQGRAINIYSGAIRPTAAGAIQDKHTSTTLWLNGCGITACNAWQVDHTPIY